MHIIDPNHGYSLGLDHPYVYGKIKDRWMVWHRRDGEVVDIIPNEYDDVLQKHAASKSCHAWNSASEWPDAATIAAIDETP